jgi:hypothetical protein
MLEALAKLKPGAPRRVHLLLAATTWTVVGASLLAAGARWSAQGEIVPLAVAIAAALFVGGLKARFALRPAAARVVLRIEERGDGRCVGGFFSWRTWIFIGCMSVAGRLLRAAGLPPDVVGIIYMAVGIALLAGSWWLWRAWRGMSRTGTEPSGGAA